MLPLLLVLAACGTWLEAEPPTELPPPRTPAEACDAGDAEACWRLGRVDAACDAGHPRACWEEGRVAHWEQGDAAAAFPHYDRACQLGEPLGCLAAGDLLRHGIGTARSLGEAEARYRSACDVLPLACELADDTARLGVRLVACQDGDPEACVAACAAGLGEACGSAGDVLARRCDGGDAEACTLLGTALSGGVGLPVDLERGQALLWRGCDLDDAWGCLRLADQLDRGVGDNPSPKTLAWLHNQVCDLQLDYGCAQHE